MTALDLATTEETVANSIGQKIFFRTWQPATAARGVVVICHGVNSHSGQHRWTAEELVADGLVVYALDLRGRGRSEGERFYVERIEDYVDDLHTVISLARGRDRSLPLFLLGHSAGGVVSCTYALEHQELLAGLICESFAFEVPAPDAALAVIKGISHLAGHLPVLKLKNEDFSRDPSVVAAMNADPLIENETQPSMTVAALTRADERLRRDFAKIALPVLILHGTADKVTRSAGSQYFFDHAGSVDKTLKLYRDHVHDLLADTDKEVVMGDIKAWIDSRLPAG